MEYKIEKRIKTTTLDFIGFNRSGIIHIDGWNRQFKSTPDLALFIDGQEIDMYDFYHIFRPDVAKCCGYSNQFKGFCCEYLISQSLEKSDVEIRLNGKRVWREKISHQIEIPCYQHLFYDTDVKHRESIYGSGPMVIDISERFRSLEYFIDKKSRVLDFGCGGGGFVKTLRALGIDAHGLEIYNPNRTGAFLPESEQYISIYDGTLPLSYPDNHFGCVVAFEVMEHVEDYETVLAETDRIAKETFIMSVPDITGIPRSCFEHVVPWHLLESTHLNFFNARSLHNVLSRFWSDIEFIKTGFTHINTSRYATNIVAVCNR